MRLASWERCLFCVVRRQATSWTLCAELCGADFQKGWNPLSRGAIDQTSQFFSHEQKKNGYLAGGRGGETIAIKLHSRWQKPPFLPLLPLSSLPVYFNPVSWTNGVLRLTSVFLFWGRELTRFSHGKKIVAIENKIKHFWRGCVAQSISIKSFFLREKEWRNQRNLQRKRWDDGRKRTRRKKENKAEIALSRGKRLEKKIAMKDVVDWWVFQPCGGKKKKLESVNFWKLKQSNVAHFAQNVYFF